MFNWKIRVYWEDTDAGGVVYNANYLKFFERARTELLRELNFQQNKLQSQLGCGFVVAQAKIDFLAPAKLDDELLILSKVIKINKASIELEQLATRLAAGVEQKLAVGRIKVAWINLHSFKPQKMPADIELSFSKLI